MDQSVLVSISVVLVLFVWVWIGASIIRRLDLERKIEKLDNIQNRLPEEERTLTQLKELRAIEQNKVGSAKLILGLFGVLTLAALGLAVLYPPVHEMFGFENLKVFASFALLVLTFMILPTYVGLSLAGSTKKDPLEKKETVTEAKGGTA